METGQSQKQTNKQTNNKETKTEMKPALLYSQLHYFYKHLSHIEPWRHDRSLIDKKNALAQLKKLAKMLLPIIAVVRFLFYKLAITP